MNTQISVIQTLVVDDSLDECTLLNFELQSIESMKLIGFVHNGIEAIHYLQGLDVFHDRKLFPYPDLMLLDFNMPKCGGMEVLKFLKREQERPHVLLWSNTLEQVNVPLALHLGADMVCEKPANRRELTRIMRELEAHILDAEPLLHSSKSSPCAAQAFSPRVLHRHD
jgi:two-component system response regulator